MRFILAIINAKIVMPDHFIYDGIVLVENGRIVSFGSQNNISVPFGSQVIDALGHYVGPGLIDIHTHAGNGMWFHEKPKEAANFHLQHGTTTVLPALYFNLTKEEYLRGISVIKQCVLAGEANNIQGLYMEGPYLNPKFGCDRENNPWGLGAQKQDYEAIVAAASDFAKVYCVAPEQNNVAEFVRYVKQAQPHMVFSVAHSEASPKQIEELIPYGLTLATHHTNATGDRPKYPECRGVCVDEVVNYRNEMYAELICDSMGIHVDPYMLRLVKKIKGQDKIILVSDCCVFDGPIPKGYDGVTDINFDYMGEIAGSKLTLDVACQNMIKHTGAGLCEIFHYASKNPARLLHMHDRGEIRVGNHADLVVVDHLMQVKHVVLAGNKVLYES